MMPVMDGLTATRQIRQDPRFKKLPIITLTAKAMPDDQEICLQAGASDYMAKPLDVDKLISLVRVWLAR
jgi:CheY-like chemotaxis protein